MQSPDSTYLKTTFYSDGHRHFVTGVVAYQRCGVKYLELCATNDTIDLIEGRCVHPMLGSCCVFAYLSDSPTNVTHSSPPGLEMTVPLAAA